MSEPPVSQESRPRPREEPGNAHLIDATQRQEPFTNYNQPSEKMISLGCLIALIRKHLEKKIQVGRSGME